MNLPRITIITPSYNQGEFIEQTICSVLDQQYPYLEYIIIDGGSTDNTVDIIKKYEKHLTYWVSEKDHGQSDAINKGYKLATGEVMNWLNSDDYYEPGTLLKVGDAFANPAVNVYGGRSRVFGDGNEHYLNGTDIYKDNLEKTIGWARIDQPETFFRKTVWDTLGGLNPAFHYIMDKEFWIRYLFYHGLQGIVKTDEVLVNFRVHKDSKTVSQKDGFKEEGINLFYSIAVENGLEKIARFFESNYNCKKIELNYTYNFGDINKALNYFLYYQLAEAYASNDKAKYRSYRKIMDKSCLSSDDKKMYHRIFLSSVFLPVTLKKMWNKL